MIVGLEPAQGCDPHLERAGREGRIEQVDLPERKMDIYLYLFETASARENGRQFDAREWPGPT